MRGTAEKGSPTKQEAACDHPLPFGLEYYHYYDKQDQERAEVEHLSLPTSPAFPGLFLVNRERPLPIRDVAFVCSLACL